MYVKIMSIAAITVMFFVFTLIKNAYCYRIPPKDSKINYLYQFGPDGKKAYGARKVPEAIFLRIPDSYNGAVEISIYDPDTGGYIDEKSGRWDTETRFSVFGGDKACSSITGVSEANIGNFRQGTLLAEKTFGEDKKYDRKYYRFAPIDASKGEKIGKHRYLKILVEGIKGDDNNMFALDIFPDEAEAFSQALNLRLSEKQEQKMTLYPYIPLGASRIIEYNFDLDPDGGDIKLIGPTRDYKVKRSGSGMWANTKIDVNPGDAGKKWIYEIIKGTQPNANMAMYLTTGDGRAIPVFFTPETRGPKRIFVEADKAKEGLRVGSEMSCNTFTFDGSKSYDPDDQELSYLWDFGDGTTSTEIRSIHTYKNAGKYLVKLTITDNSEAECNTATTRQVVKVNQPPYAVVSGPHTACVNAEITFDGSRSSDSPEDRLSYKWDFGDGQTAEGAKASHKYAKGGNYLVTLTVKDDSGTICDTGVDRLSVLINTPPVAETGPDMVSCINNEIEFDGSKSYDADKDRLTYKWDFGDGNSAEGVKVKHAYRNIGMYKVTLLVTDDSGSACDTSTHTLVAAVNAEPVPVIEIN